MNRRKFFGTILGIIFWSICVVFFTYAYYDWKSDPTNVVLGIEDLSVECLVGANVNVINIGPVLNYQDGVKAEFSINNEMSDNMAIELYLYITSISDISLLTESLKYILVADSTSGTNYDYNNPIREGNLSNFNLGNNLITYDLEVTASTTTNYQFIIYVDGNMDNNIDMQENSLTANLLIGNCGEDALPYDELAYQAIYSETDNSLTFVHTIPLSVGDTYNDKAVTAVYTGFETANYASASSVPWYKDGNYANIRSVTFEEVVSPISTAYWFYEFSNLKDIDLEKLDTSNVANMIGMFRGCGNLIELDLSSFDTSNVTAMNDSNYWSFNGMFTDCHSLRYLDISNFNTSKLTSFVNMFAGCISLIELDLSNFDTSNATDITCMFRRCQSLIELDISNFNTSKVLSMCINVYGLFQECMSLRSLDISNFDTSNVTYMAYMFENCNSLVTLNIDNFDTSNVTNMTKMFEGCNSLVTLNIDNFDTSNVTNMSRMFFECKNLINIDVGDFNTSKVTNMTEMFRGCEKIISLDVSKFDMSNVVSVDGMFSYCYNLEFLDLNNWDISKVTACQLMFYYCYNLSTSLVITNPNISSYWGMFTHTANTKGIIKVYYIVDNPNTLDVNESTYNLVESMVATKTGNNVINAGCYGDNCPVET